jgi:hypothetical protein
VSETVRDAILWRVPMVEIEVRMDLPGVFAGIL